MKNFKGIVYAALSSSTFGLAPLFSILLLSDGFSSFEVLSYRWGVASLTLGIVGLAGGCRFRISRQELCTVFFLSLFRAATSLSLVIAYQNISSGVASIIHFMYPLANAIESGELERGIGLCGSGEGMAITLNKHQGIRAGLVWDKQIAHLIRQHNNANVIVLPARFITNDQAVEFVEEFLATDFEGGRHQRRIEKIPVKACSRQ